MLEEDLCRAWHWMWSHIGFQKGQNCFCNQNMSEISLQDPVGRQGTDVVFWETARKGICGLGDSWQQIPTHLPRVGKPAEPAAPTVLTCSWGTNIKLRKKHSIKIMHLLPLFIDVQRMGTLQRPFDELIQANSHLQHVLAKACGSTVETTLTAFLFSCPFMWQRSWECVWTQIHRNKDCVAGGIWQPCGCPQCICVPWAGRTGQARPSLGTRNKLWAKPRLFLHLGLHLYTAATRPECLQACVLLLCNSRVNYNF